MFTNLIIQQLPQISLLLDANHVTELTGIVKEINQNTDSWHGMNILFTLISFIAALVTIMGLVMVVYAIVKNKCSNRCQQKIIEDLLRHFFINNQFWRQFELERKTIRSYVQLMAYLAVLQLWIRMWNWDASQIQPITMN